MAYRHHHHHLTQGGFFPHHHWKSPPAAWSHKGPSDSLVVVSLPAAHGPWLQRMSLNFPLKNLCSSKYVQNIYFFFLVAIFENLLIKMYDFLVLQMLCLYVFPLFVEPLLWDHKWPLLRTWCPRSAERVEAKTPYNSTLSLEKIDFLVKHAHKSTLKSWILSGRSA